MPVSLRVAGGRSFESTKTLHAEKQLYDHYKKDKAVTPLTLTMDAWPCAVSTGFSCHQLLRILSMKRTITLIVSDDHGAYAADHNLAAGSTGTIIYNNGAVTYEPANPTPAVVPAIHVATKTPTKSAGKKKKK